MLIAYCSADEQLFHLWIWTLDGSLDLKAKSFHFRMIKVWRNIHHRRCLSCMSVEVTNWLSLSWLWWQIIPSCSHTYITLYWNVVDPDNVVCRNSHGDMCQTAKHFHFSVFSDCWAQPHSLHLFDVFVKRSSVKAKPELIVFNFPFNSLQEPIDFQSSTLDNDTLTKRILLLVLFYI